MSEETETPKPADVAGRIDGLVGQTLITMTASHNPNIGDKIEITRLDYRWWMRLWCWATFRPRPMITDLCEVRGVETITFTIAPPNDGDHAHERSAAK
jgi:hypothetical protein